MNSLMSLHRTPMVPLGGSSVGLLEKRENAFSGLALDSQTTLIGAFNHSTSDWLSWDSNVSPHMNHASDPATHTMGLGDSLAILVDRLRTLTHTLNLTNTAHVALDGYSPSGSGGSGDPDLSKHDVIADSTVVTGQLVYISSSNHIELSLALPSGNDYSRTRVAAMCLTGAATGGTATILTEGSVELADWSAITGTTYLIPGKTYYMLDTVLGGMHYAPPASSIQVIVRVGRAITTTKFDIEIAQPINVPDNSIKLFTVTDSLTLSDTVSTPVTLRKTLTSAISLSQLTETLGIYNKTLSNALTLLGSTILNWEGAGVDTMAVTDTTNFNTSDMLKWEYVGADRWQAFEDEVTDTINTTGTNTFNTFNTVSSATNKWWGGVLAPNGTSVYCAPYNMTTILKIDTTINTISTFGTFNTVSSKWAGGVLAPNGSIYFAPNAAGHILKLNTSNDATTQIAVTSASCFGGVHVGEGIIYFAGFSNIIKLNTNNDAISYITGTASSVGCVLAKNGDVYCVPTSGTTITRIHTNNDTVTTFGSFSGSNQYHSAALAKNGTDIYCIPETATKVLKIDTVNDTTSLVGTDYGSTSGKWRGAVLAANGKIHGIPHTRADVLVIDPSTDTTSTFGSISLAGKFNSATVALNGVIYCVPHNATYIGRITPASANTLQDDVILSGYWNKL